MQIKKQGTCGTYRSEDKEHTPIEKETIINNSHAVTAVPALGDDNP